jgi:hypothetical protein
LLPGIVKLKGVWKSALDAERTFCILAILGAFFLKLFGIVDESFNASFFSTALFRRERLAVVGCDFAGGRLACLNIKLVRDRK